MDILKIVIIILASMILTIPLYVIGIYSALFSIAIIITVYPFEGIVFIMLGVLLIGITGIFQHKFLFRGMVAYQPRR